MWERRKRNQCSTSWNREEVEDKGVEEKKETKCRTSWKNAKKRNAFSSLRLPKHLREGGSAQARHVYNPADTTATDRLQLYEARDENRWMKTGLNYRRKSVESPSFKSTLGQTQRQTRLAFQVIQIQYWINCMYSAMATQFGEAKLRCVSVRTWIPVWERLPKHESVIPPLSPAIVCISWQPTGCHWLFYARTIFSAQKIESSFLPSLSLP